jgi:hypothetical protein
MSSRALASVALLLVAMLAIEVFARYFYPRLFKREPWPRMLLGYSYRLLPFMIASIIAWVWFA